MITARSAMRSFLSLVGLLVFAIALSPSPVLADGKPWLDEAKVGVLAHDIGFLGHHVESGADANGEILFASPGFLDAIGSPRPHLGGSINTAGNTDYGYFGLTWDATLLRGFLGSSDSLIVAGSLGGAVHDGHLTSGPSNRKLLGTRVLFRESVELGYHVNPTWSLSVLLDHLSNAGIGRHNQGLNDVGLRTGVKF